MSRANAAHLDGASSERERETFVLRQLAMQAAHLSMEFMFCCLISSKSVEDIIAINPLLTPSEAELCLDQIASCSLHASRVHQINRAVVEAKSLLKLLRPRDGFGATNEARREAAAAIALKSDTLAGQLASTRNYCVQSAVASATDLGLSYDPRFLLFEFTHNIVLRKSQVELVREFVATVRSGRPLVKQMLMGGGKTTVVGPLLCLLLAR